MSQPVFRECGEELESQVAALRGVLEASTAPWAAGASVGVKIHWGERGNHHFLDPALTAEVVRWLKEQGAQPFVFDTTVLYSGGRREGAEALRTAAQHGFTEEALGCPIRLGDGLDGRATIDLEAGYEHFADVQVGRVVEEADGFVLLSHVKAHMVAGFGGAIKNLSMGFASRAQKQRMHSDARPVLSRRRCTRCGVCAEVCPTGAAQQVADDFPTYDEELCTGCAQCIAQCPEVALRIFWGTDQRVFQEKLIETAAAVWRRIEGRTLCVNALVSIVSECDCMSGRHATIAPDMGMLATPHPVAADLESLRRVGGEPFRRAHPGASWDRQLEYAQELGFWPAEAGTSGGDR